MKITTGRIIPTWLISCLIISGINAWTSRSFSNIPKSKPLYFKRISSAESTKEFRQLHESGINEQQQVHASTRRQWFVQNAGLLGLTGFGWNIAGRKASAEQTRSALCDPTVVILEKFVNGSRRRIYILGTAHISESSAALAGQLVREIHPDAVFVELDAKRVGRLVLPPPTVPPSSSPQSSSPQSFSTQGSPQATLPIPRPTPILADMKENIISSQLAISVAIAALLNFENPISTFQNRLQKAATDFVGGQIKGLYQQLENEGFSAGEEFVVAVKEGLAINATIVLGDRDVDVTLSRLTQAIQKTDLKKLLTDPTLNDPNGLGDGGQIGGGDGIKLNPQTGTFDIKADELRGYVETLKTKEKVNQLMYSFKTAAPEIYQAMVAERDIYMGDGLNRLGSLSSNNSDTLAMTTTSGVNPSEYSLRLPFENIVAVMGLAHLDGVKTYLVQEGGWREIPPPRTC